jgi:hypothetical protein
MILSIDLSSEKKPAAKSNTQPFFNRVRDGKGPSSQGYPMLEIFKHLELSLIR